MNSGKYNPYEGKIWRCESKLQMNKLFDPVGEISDFYP